MKVIRFRHNQSIYYGELQGNEIYQLTDAPWFQGKRTEQYFELNQVELISPCKPGKIIATAINYTGATGLSDSTDEPLVFFKPSTLITLSKHVSWNHGRSRSAIAGFFFSNLPKPATIQNPAL